MSQAPTQSAKSKIGSFSRDDITGAALSQSASQFSVGLGWPGQPSNVTKDSSGAFNTKSNRACEACRVKKVTCSKDMPKCMTCTNSNRTCVFADLKRKPRATKACESCASQKLKCGWVSGTGGSKGCTYVRGSESEPGQDMGRTSNRPEEETRTGVEGPIGSGLDPASASLQAEVADWPQQAPTQDDGSDCGTESETSEIDKGSHVYPPPEPVAVGEPYWV